MARRGSLGLGLFDPQLSVRQVVTHAKGILSPHPPTLFYAISRGYAEPMQNPCFLSAPT